VDVARQRAIPVSLGFFAVLPGNVLNSILLSHSFIRYLSLAIGPFPNTKLFQNRQDSFPCLPVEMNFAILPAHLYLPDT